MKIELKGLRIFLAGSQETICFVADVYINGVKAAEAKNDGQGGCTFIGAYTGQSSLVSQAEKAMDLEGFVDGIVCKEAAKKETEKATKQAEKSMLTNMLFTTEDNYLDGYYKIPLINSITKKKMPIEELLKMPKGIDAIRNTVKNQIQKGARLVNTNIPEHIYK